MKTHIFELFTQQGIASTLLFIALISISGILLGKIKVFNVKLGIAGVLFSGILLGHLGAEMHTEVLHFVKEFGLILFVFSIGLDIGPRFVSSFRNNGIKLNILSLSVIFLGFGIALLIQSIWDIDVEVIAGILSGAVTNTPSLGAAQSVLQDQLPNAEHAVNTTGMAYAVAYPFGIIGIILVMSLIRVFFKIKITHEIEEYNREVTGLSGKAEAIQIQVQNPNIIGKTIALLEKSLDTQFVFSRILRNNEFIISHKNVILQKNDILYGVSSTEMFEELELKVGTVSKTERVEITGNLTMRHVLVTNKSVAGKTLQQIGISEQFPANITRIFRGGNEIMPNKKSTLEFGDTVCVVAQRRIIDEVTKYLGNSQRSLALPNLLPLFIGIFLGIIVGSIPIFIPGLPVPAKLGLAGGPLIVALILGHKGRIGKFDFYMAPSANLFIRELGIVLFLGCVGLGAGKNFIETITNGGYMWMMYGAIITFVPIFVVGIIAYFLKYNYLTICGIIAGSMTDPPALEFANAIAPVQAQATAYATVYPLTMFMRILLAQILVLVLV
ncbi:MAG: putative transporter [Bacteroidales bacterium]|jgi:putative transport protein|nr:putative transporter [Bacteroidales bacterium]